MRMLVIGPTPLTRTSALRAQLVDSLRFLGHEVVSTELPADDGVARARLEKQLARFGPDLLINVPTNGSLSGEVLRELTAATGTVAVCVHRGPTCASSPTRLDQVGDDLREYDLVTVPDPATYAEWLPEGTFRLSLLEPAVHVPGLEGVVSAARAGAVLLGDADPENIDVVAGLSDVDDLVVFGDGWDELPLDVEVATASDLVERGTLFAGARLVVELPASLRHCSSIGRHWSELGLSDAVLEAAAVGTPAVVLDRPGVGELLEPGLEVLTCRSPGDFVSLVPLLLASPDELALVGDAAWQCVTSRHTWASRWDQLLGRWTDPHEIDTDEDVRRIATVETTAGV